MEIEGCMVTVGDGKGVGGGMVINRRLHVKGGSKDNLLKGVGKSSTLG